ncbi:50S ribosomal protein L9 [Candidatus Peregrinibacteria bacterium]|nr:MAG: 50S ribosomal protein L9 [Candidatus Peregrinibacteria bacterium]
MQVVLTKAVKSLGYEHDIVNVKRGYAANYLLPNGLAMLATPAVIKKTEALRAERVRHLEELKAKAKELLEQLRSVTLSFTMKARGDKLYGSITEKDIVDAVKNQAKIEIEKDMVSMKEHIKSIGAHQVKLHLAQGVTATVKVMVEAE